DVPWFGVFLHCKRTRRTRGAEASIIDWLCSRCSVRNRRTRGFCVIRSRRSYGKLGVNENCQRRTANVLLPTIVRESFIRFRHLVRVFSLLDRVAAVVGGIHDLAGELVLHRLLAAARRRCRKIG